MKIFKVALYALWAICLFIVAAFVVSWISNSEAVLAWGYFGMIGLPITVILTVLYIILNKAFPNGKLF